MTGSEIDVAGAIEVDGIPHLTVKQLADQRGVAPSTANRWVRIGLFPNAKKLPIANGTWAIPVADIGCAVFPESAGSKRLVRAGKISAKFIEQMKTLIDNAEDGAVLTVDFETIAKSTAKGHLRNAAKQVGKSVRFQPSGDTQLTFKVKGGRGESADKSTHAGDNITTAVDGTHHSERQANREPAVDAA